MLSWTLKSPLTVLGSPWISSEWGPLKITGRMRKVKLDSYLPDSQ